MTGNGGSTPSRMWSQTQTEFETQRLSLKSVVDQPLRIGHFRPGRKIPHRQAEGVRKDRHRWRRLSGGVEAIGVEMAQHGEFVLARRIGDREIGRSAAIRSRCWPAPRRRSRPDAVRAMSSPSICSSKPKNPRSVTTRNMPPAIRPASRRLSPPSRNPGLVKSRPVRQSAAFHASWPRSSASGWRCRCRRRFPASGSSGFSGDQ